MRIRNRSLSWLPAVGAIALLMIAACAARRSEGGTNATHTGGVTPVAAQDRSQTLAIVDGRAITLADLDEVIGDQLATLETTYGSQRSQLLQDGLERVLNQRLLEAAAAEAGTDVQALLAERVGIIQVSDDEVSEWYQANRARLEGRPLETLQPAIRQFLTEQKQQTRIEELVAEISAGREVEILLEPFRVDIDIAGHPAAGPEDAPVVLVEFSDFECPYCGAFIDTLEQIKSEYGDSVRLVYRQFPLTQIHANAMKAAEASLCAQEQGKFWELHDVMFAEQSRLTVSDLQEKARRVGMDGGAFDACLSSGKYTEQVETDLQLGQRLGVGGTPAMFVNGIPMQAGAVPYESLARAIDEELQRRGR